MATIGLHLENKALDQRTKTQLELYRAEVQQKQLDQVKDFTTKQLEQKTELENQIKKLQGELQSKANAASQNALIAKVVPQVQAASGSHADWLNAAGVPESEWANVDFIVSRESGWNPSAVNKSSGACSLMQALPCSKIPGNWNNPVDALKWGNSYVVSRYGSWAGAVAFWQTHHWY